MNQMKVRIKMKVKAKGTLALRASRNTKKRNMRFGLIRRRVFRKSTSSMAKLKGRTKGPGSKVSWNSKAAAGAKTSIGSRAKRSNRNTAIKKRRSEGYAPRIALRKLLNVLPLRARLVTLSGFS